LVQLDIRQIQAARHQAGAELRRAEISVQTARLLMSRGAANDRDPPRTRNLLLGVEKSRSARGRAGWGGKVGALPSLLSSCPPFVRSVLPGRRGELSNRRGYCSQSMFGRSESARKWPAIRVTSHWRGVSLDELLSTTALTFPPGSMPASCVAGHFHPSRAEGLWHPFHAQDEGRPDLQEDRQPPSGPAAARPHQDGQHCPLPQRRAR
jgi:hypothetical protein